MGRKAMHTAAEVFEVADRMAANGQEVTPTALLQALGGGSLTTIYKHLDAWQTSKKDAPVSVVYEMPEPVKSAFNGVWQVAANEAAKEVTAIREKADAEVKAVVRRLDEAVSNIEQLESEADADTTKIEALESQLLADKSAADNFATQAVARESALLATVEQMRKQIDAQALELARVHVDHDSARKAHADELARLTSDFARQLTDQADALRAAHDESGRVRSKMEADAAKNEQALERLRRKADTDASQLAEAQGDVKRLAVEAKNEQLRHGIAIKKLEDDQAMLRAEATEAVRQLAAATGECEALRAQVTSQLLLIHSLTAKTEPMAAEDGVSATAKHGTGSEKDKDGGRSA